MPRITEMFAFVVSDTAPDDEGVPAFLDPATGSMMPLMGADLARVDSLRPIAQQLARLLGKQVRLLRWMSPPTVVETIEP